MTSTNDAGGRARRNSFAACYDAFSAQRDSGSPCTTSQPLHHVSRVATDASDRR